MAAGKSNENKLRWLGLFALIAIISTMCYMTTIGVGISTSNQLDFHHQEQPEFAEGQEDFQRLSRKPKSPKHELHSTEQAELQTVWKTVEGELSWKLAGLLSYIRPFMDELETLRNDTLLTATTTPWLPISAKRHVANQYVESYFKEVSQFTQIKTVVFGAPLGELRRYMIKNYYNYASIDCELVEKNSNYGKRHGLSSMNTRCDQDPSHAALHPYPLQQRTTSVGLPQNFLQTYLGMNSTTESWRSTKAVFKYVFAAGMNLSHKARSLNDNNNVSPVASISDNTINRKNFDILTYIHVIKCGVVLPDGDITSGGVTLLPPRCSQKKKVVVSKSKAEKLPLYDEIFSISQYFGDTYYHATVENLPRLAVYLDFLRKHPGIYIHAGMRHKFLIEILGIPAKRVLTGAVRGRVVYMPAGNTCGQSPIFSTQLLSYRLRRNLARITKDPLTSRKTIVLIRRSDPKRRFFRHESILKMLKEKAGARKLSVVVFADNPVPGSLQTGKIFADARLVIAPHGAGTSNVLFSAPGTVLLEGLCWGRSNLCFRNLAQVLGIRYFGMLYKKSCNVITANDLGPYVEKYLSLYDQGLI